MQKQQTSVTSEQIKSRKNKYDFNLQRGRRILIESDFDNGNIHLVRQVTQLQYRLAALSDFKSATTKKTWFHFRVSAPKGIRVRLIIQNVSIYQNMYEDTDWAKPVMNDGQGWREVKDSFLTYRGQVGIIIDYTFTAEIFVYFAMAVPHTYQESQNYLKQLAFKIPQFVQYEDEIIGKSLGGLNLHLLKFTAKQVKNKQQKNNSSGNLLAPKRCIEDSKNNPRMYSQSNIQNTVANTYNSVKKPIILITSRVHPGEVGSSHCLMGIIDFLIRPTNLQSYLLLRMFQVMIIPIVNPDGVYEGHYRMDLNNTNLNRVYQEPSPELHPTVYRIKQIVANLINPTVPNKQKNDKMMALLSRKIMFHFDLHSHSCIKSAFIYGNAFDQIVTQTQSQLYCRLLQQNTQVFKYGLSHFGEKHMKMKDKGEPLTKEGCARVVISKMGNVTYSYTVQTGIFPYLNKQSLLPASNSQFKFSQQYHYEETNTQALISRYHLKNQLMIDNMLLGCGLMTTILDLVQKNPYSRFPNLEETLQTYRKQISQNLLQNQDRFKLLDIKAYQKVRNISKLCKDQYSSKHAKYWDYINADKKIMNAKWPPCFKMFQPTVNNNIDIDMLRRKNRIKTQSDSQRQVSDFLNPKNYKRRYMNLQTQGTEANDFGTKANNNQISPTKSSISQRNIQIQLDLQPIMTSNASSSHLPEIRSSLERNSMNKNRGFSNSLSKRNSNNHQDSNQIGSPKQSIRQHKQSNELKQIKELKQLQQLKQKESTKNIVLSFIHEQMQKMNTIRKNVQKSMAVQNRLASYKLVKKATRSTKNLQTIGAVSAAANKYGIVLSSNNVLMSACMNNMSDNSQMLSQSKSKKRLLTMETCEQIVNRRRNYTINNNDDEQQKQYEEEEGIYYEQNKQQERQLKTQESQMEDNLAYLRQNRNRIKNIHSLPKNRNNRVPGSLQKIAEYPVYPPPEKDKDCSGLVITSKRQLAKMKYSQIKKKNIIRQDLSNAVKLPELRGINSTNSQSANLLIAQSFGNNPNNEDKKSSKNTGNRVNINLNLNLNLNVCIQGGLGEMAGRARAATMPDQL